MVTGLSIRRSYADEPPLTRDTSVVVYDAAMRWDPATPIVPSSGSFGDNLTISFASSLPWEVPSRATRGAPPHRAAFPPVHC